ncbi:hypothetical protein QOZ80_8BG0668020 [Eleusine coracana subsp. coracana]|nr:hypothetical protein QOZ80_8BG0668020 [Eleusine coracana subsp. coracana]
MAESLLLPLVRGVVGKAGDALVKRITHMWGIDGDREKLEDWLVYVSRMLAHAEVKAETDPAVKRWMKNLKTAVYQADDVLDNFEYEALRREAQGARSMTSKVLSNFTRHNPLLFRLKMSRELKNVLDKIEGLVSDMNRFALVERAEVPQVVCRQTRSGLDLSEEILGREDEMEKVVKLLLDQQDQQSVQVLPIIGMGGLGKTTIAKMVYNDNRIQKHFELKTWYCVSENFEATTVVRSVIELATKDRCKLPDNIELLQGRLQQVIGRKRFLLILDDVWNQEQHKWNDDLRPLLCSSTSGLGSMIVVTSRLQQVASIMGTLPSHELKFLSEDDSWKLFSNKAFIDKGPQEQIELVSVGKDIVKKCKGLPLALKTMGGLMSSKQHVQEWKAIANCTVSDTHSVKHEVMPILKLSYTHLPSEMKQCFAFCAVFPKGYWMRKDRLVQLWMANGYIHEEETMDLEQKGEFIFNYLAWGSFLQDMTDLKYTPGHKVHGCKMHDLMHDLAHNVASECATEEDLIKKKISIKDVRQLYISGNHQLKKISPLFKGTVYLRTLWMQPSLRNTNVIESKLIPSRALRCSREDPSIISRQLMHITHLRYLDLSCSEMVRLPDSICMLYNLQTLMLDDCYQLQYLPKDMKTMRKLRHLHLFQCFNLKRMPAELGLLHNLRTLTIFIVGTEDGYGIEQLKDLRYLSNRLTLYNLRKAKSGSKANLQEKQNLSELSLHWGRFEFGNHGIDESRNEEEVLESLVPHNKLQILEVHGYGGLEISQWMRDPLMFGCLRALIIANCPRCKDLPVVWMSSCLEHLSLHSMENITALFKNVHVEARTHNTSLQFFPKLKMLELCYLPQLVIWTEKSATVTFPLLENLTITGCNKLASLPNSPILSHLSYTCAEGLVSMSLPLGFWPSLVELEVQGPINLVVMPLEEQQGHIKLDTLRKLKVSGDDSFLALFDLKFRDCFAFVVELKISSCLNIVRWPVEELRCLPALRSLSIESCHNLVGDRSSSEEIFLLPQLKYLRIYSSDSLQDFPEVATSLEEVFILHCEKLVALSGLVNLVKLRKLSIIECRGLKVLPAGMEGLTSLEDLEIHDCPGIEKFPHGLLQRLTTLTRLEIEDCPNLQRRCKQGGEYFDLISSIPNLQIGVMDAFFKRL